MSNPITEAWPTPARHTQWMLGGDTGTICYGCWHTTGQDIQWPCPESEQ